MDNVELFFNNLSILSNLFSFAKAPVCQRIGDVLLKVPNSEWYLESKASLTISSLSSSIL